MTAATALASARRFRSEQELREAVTCGSPARVKAACQRAEAAGVPRAHIDAALAKAEQFHEEAAGGDAKEPEEVVGARARTGLAFARQLRAEQELRQASRSGDARRVEAAQKRAEAAGMSPADVEAALAEGQEVFGAQAPKDAMVGKAGGAVIGSRPPAVMETGLMGAAPAAEDMARLCADMGMQKEGQQLMVSAVGA